MTRITDSAMAVKLRRQLAARLADRGAIRSNEWRRVFETVPRHLFVPRFYRNGENGPVLFDSSVPDQHDQWLTGTYGDEALTVAYDPANQTTPLSSSSMPTLMAVMLEALDVSSGQTVLEIGTGTGYNAALLCERLGSHLVTTVDIDEQLVAEARERLNQAGYSPTVAIADGQQGLAENTPYDRLIATCAVTHLPPAWFDQVRPGGLILAILGTGLLKVEVRDGGEAEGRFLRTPLRYMRMRGQGPATPPTRDLLELTGQHGQKRVMRHPGTIADDDSFWFFLRLAHLPHVLLFGKGEEFDRVVDLTDLSWAHFAADGKVIEGGPRRLWSEIEDAYEDWSDLGRATRERFGMTFTVGRRHVWLDRSGSDHSWEV